MSAPIAQATTIAFGVRDALVVNRDGWTRTSNLSLMRGLLCLSYIASCRLSHCIRYSRVINGHGWNRTNDFLLVTQAIYR